MGTVLTNSKRIANYELEELIGSGGMANIYKGLQLSLERPVALKVLHQHLTQNENFIARFEQEAKRAAMLHHENIVSIIDYGRQNDEYFIAMEYVEGQNLKEMKTRMKRLPLEVALLICREVAYGLKYAHNHGVVHRDIKPANIVLSTDGRVMITDFGIAKTHDDVSITATGQMIGSPAYMSPEQAAGRPIDERSDIFSLGIVLYEMITGEKPFKGESYQEMIASIISSAPVEPSLMRIDVSPALEDIVKKALAKDIESRFPNADEMASSLNEQLAGYAIPSSKKLISEFLKNPIRTTEKLRTNRISRHMEAALYLVNLGHGRLADATREFENVLRYDKKNKMAREYLEKLRTGQSEFVGKRSAKNINLQLRLSAIGGIIVLVIAFLSIFMGRNGPTGDAQTAASTVRDGSTRADMKIEGSKESENFAMKSPETPSGTGAISPDILGQKGGSSTRGGSEIVSSKRKKAPKKVAGKANNKYIYPNQNLASYGFLEIVSTPQGTFYVDLKEYGRTGGPPVKLAPGRHAITIKAEGYRPVKKRIFTEVGKTEMISVTLRAER